MKIVRKENAQILDGAENMTGEGQMEIWLPAQTPGGIRMTIVSFKDGARTYWHDHPGEQVLIVLDGVGRVGNAAGDEATVYPGDVIHTPAGEKHWHGAAEGHDMSHISITNVGSPNWTDEAPQ